MVIGINNLKGKFSKEVQGQDNDSHKRISKLIKTKYLSNE
jgi:hypothetical protein